MTQENFTKYIKRKLKKIKIYSYKNKSISSVDILETLVSQTKDEIEFWKKFWKIPKKYHKRFDGRYIHLNFMPFIFIFDKENQPLGIYNETFNKFIDKKKVSFKQIIKLYL